MNRIVVESGTDWLTPVATLLAVLIGGGVTWIVQAALARRRENAEAKASARVIQGDLAMQASRIKDMVMDDHQWYGFYDLNLPRWETHSPVIALKLSERDWNVVSQSALELASLTDAMARALGPGGPHAGARVIPLNAKGLTSMRNMWTNASDAHRALAKLAGVAPESGMLHEHAKPFGT